MAFDFFTFFKKIFKPKPKVGHKKHCWMSGKRFTVIANAEGRKVSEWAVQYCPICGRKLTEEA